MDYSDSYLAEKKSIVPTPKKGSSVRPKKADNPNRKKNRSSKLAKRREDWKKAEQEALKQLEDLNNVQYEKDNYLTEPAEAALGKRIIKVYTGSRKNRSFLSGLVTKTGGGREGLCGH